jgi:hypothetical protein
MFILFCILYIVLPVLTVFNNDSLMQLCLLCIIQNICQDLVLHPSCVPEKVGVNKENINKKCIPIRRIKK